MHTKKGKKTQRGKRKMQTQRDALCLSPHPRPEQRRVSQQLAHVWSLHILPALFMSPGDTQARESQEAKSYKGHQCYFSQLPHFR